MPLHLRTRNGGGDPPRRANKNRTWIPEKLLTFNLGSSLGELGLCWLSHLLHICEGAISQLPPQPLHVLDIGGTQGGWNLRFATPPRSAHQYFTNGGRPGARLSRETAPIVRVVNIGGQGPPAADSRHCHGRGASSVAFFRPRGVQALPRRVAVPTLSRPRAAGAAAAATAAAAKAAKHQLFLRRRKLGADLLEIVPGGRDGAEEPASTPAAGAGAAAAAAATAAAATAAKHQPFLRRRKPRGGLARNLPRGPGWCGGTRVHPSSTAAWLWEWDGDLRARPLSPRPSPRVFPAHLRAILTANAAVRESALAFRRTSGRRARTQSLRCRRTC